MKDFIALQKRARELEHRIRHIHEMLKDLSEHRRHRAIKVERRLVKEWEFEKRRMAHMIYEHKRIRDNYDG